MDAMSWNRLFSNPSTLPRLGDAYDADDRSTWPRVGDVYDQFGYKWTITKLHLKKREVSVAGDEGRDSFGRPYQPKLRRMNVANLESLLLVKRGP